MLYTAVGLASSKITQHFSFQQRGIKNLTQSKLSDVTAMGKTLYPQLAFDGYAANIEAFMWSTWKKQRVATTYYSYTIDMDDEPDIPLLPPKIAFVLKTVPTPATKAKMLEAWEQYGLKEITLSKSTKGWTMDKPKFSLIPKLKQIAELNMGTPSGYCSLAGFIEAQKLYTFLALFMRTHTYPAFSVNEKEDDEDYPEPANENIYVQSRKRARAEEKTTRRKAQVVGEPGMMERITRDTPEPEEATLEIFRDVMFAKPSPMPSSISHGPPTSVPFLPGLVFPYFNGLLAADPSFVKRVVADRFFKLLGEDVREAYKSFRANVATFVYTPEGLIVSHMLQAVDLALQTQTHAYFMFDQSDYLGFSLLGGFFSVMVGNTWHAPGSAEAVREEVTSLITHSSRLDIIAELVTKIKMPNGNKYKKFATVHIDTSAKLAKLLGTLDLAGESENPAMKSLVEHLERLSFKDTFLSQSIEHMLSILPALFDRAPPPVADTDSVYIPTAALETLCVARNHHLLRFGPRSPSFYSSTGSKIFVPAPGEKDTQKDVDVATGKIRMSTFLVTMKPISQAAADLVKTLEERSVRFDVKERAKDSRCVAFKDKAAVKIWDGLVNTLGKLEFVKAKKGKGPDNDMAVDIVDINDFEF